MAKEKSGGMHPAALAGLKKWGKDKPTSEITEHLEAHGVESTSEPGEPPAALAVWIRKKAIGAKAFEAHQKAARKGKSSCG